MCHLDGVFAFEEEWHLWAYYWQLQSKCLHSHTWEQMKCPAGREGDLQHVPQPAGHSSTKRQKKTTNKIRSEFPRKLKKFLYLTHHNGMVVDTSKSNKYFHTIFRPSFGYKMCFSVPGPAYEIPDGRICWNVIETGWDWHQLTTFSRLIKSKRGLFRVWTRRLKFSIWFIVRSTLLPFCHHGSPSQTTFLKSPHHVIDVWGKCKMSTDHQEISLLWFLIRRGRVYHKPDVRLTPTRLRKVNAGRLTSFSISNLGEN